MEVGELMRLKQPFRPTPNSQDYSFGLVAGLVFDDSTNLSQPELTEIVLRLYDPETATTYTDELGEQVMYSFYPIEIEPMQ